MGFTSHQPWYLACPFVAAHLSEKPVANWGNQALSLYTPQPPRPSVLCGPHSWPHSWPGAVAGEGGFCAIPEAAEMGAER